MSSNEENLSRRSSARPLDFYQEENCVSALPQNGFSGKLFPGHLISRKYLGAAADEAKIESKAQKDSHSKKQGAPQ